MFIRHSVDIVGDIADLAEMAYRGESIDKPAVTEVEEKVTT